MYSFNNFPYIRNTAFFKISCFNKIIKIFYKSLLLLKYFVRHEVVIVQWCSVTSLECFLWLLRIHFTRKSGKVLLCLQYWLGAQVSQWGQRHMNFNFKYGLCNFMQNFLQHWIMYILHCKPIPGSLKNL